VVLPFLNLSGDPAQEYFSDAMTDEIITELAGLAPEELAVIARTTAMRYKGSRKDVTRIARELGVEYIVDGGVGRAEDRIALNVQLVRASDRMHVFARRYQAAFTDIFKIQSCAARDIAANIDNERITNAVRATGTARAMGRRSRTQNPGAYDEYLRARSHMARVTPEAFARARQHLEEALSRDPAFALAYDGLAELYWYLAYFGFMSPRDAFSTGVLYAIRALEIDNSLGETHALLGLYQKQLTYDWPEVEREMARALELSPRRPLSGSVTHSTSSCRTRVSKKRRRNSSWPSSGIRSPSLSAASSRWCWRSDTAMISRSKRRDGYSSSSRGRIGAML
jgi:TolB-like protein